jgi:hypothetical protein
VEGFSRVKTGMTVAPSEAPPEPVSGVAGAR